MAREPHTFTETDWFAPVQQIGPEHWTESFLDQFARLIEVVEEARQDPMGADHWKSVEGRFDAGVDPRTPEEANERWRELLIGTWRTVEAYNARRAVQRAALARRQARVAAPSGKSATEHRSAK